MLQNAKWVKAFGPTKGPARLKYEMGLMKQQYPQFDFYIDSDGCTMYVDGYIITQGKNAFHVRIYFPDNYPYYPPLPIVLDEDMIMKKKTLMDFPHNRGIQNGGVALCVIKPDDTIGQPWTPKLSSVSVVKFAGKWLQAYELWEKKKKWYLREV